MAKPMAAAPMMADSRAGQHELGLTQAELGELLGVKTNTVARCERVEQCVRAQASNRVLTRLG